MTLLVGSIFHMTRKIVSEMTYNVSMGTLNPTILYYTENVAILLVYQITTQIHIREIVCVALIVSFHSKIFYCTVLFNILLTFLFHFSPKRFLWRLSTDVLETLCDVIIAPIENLIYQF